MQDHQASHTAYTVLQGVVHTGQQARTRSLVSEKKLAVCRAILNSSEEGRKRLKQADSPVHSAGLMLMQRLLLPGIALHYVARKKAIADMVRSQKAQGVRQFINLGAGFDTLMLELSQDHSDLHCVELDHPATSEQKRQAFVEHAPENLHLHAVDLSETELAQALAEIPAFEAKADTCFICEGVLMYLAPSDVERLLRVLQTVTSGRVQLVFTAAAPLDSPNTNATWLLKRYLHRLGEPLKWTMEQSDIQDFLNAQGYRLDRVMGGDALREQYLSHLTKGPFHRGEYVVSCTPDRQD